MGQLIELLCECGKSLSVPIWRCGQRGRCMHCQCRVLIPETKEELMGLIQSSGTSEKISTSIEEFGENVTNASNTDILPVDFGSEFSAGINQEQISPDQQQMYAGQQYDIASEQMYTENQYPSESMPQENMIQNDTAYEYSGAEAYNENYYPAGEYGNQEFYGDQNYVEDDVEFQEATEPIYDAPAEHVEWAKGTISEIKLPENNVEKKKKSRRKRRSRKRFPVKFILFMFFIGIGISGYMFRNHPVIAPHWKKILSQFAEKNSHKKGSIEQQIENTAKQQEEKFLQITKNYKQFSSKKLDEMIYQRNFEKINKELENFEKNLERFDPGQDKHKKIKAQYIAQIQKKKRDIFYIEKKLLGIIVYKILKKFKQKKKKCNVYLISGYSHKRVHLGTITREYVNIYLMKKRKWKKVKLKEMNAWWLQVYIKYALPAYRHKGIVRLYYHNKENAKSLYYLGKLLICDSRIYQKNARWKKKFLDKAIYFLRFSAKHGYKPAENLLKETK